MKVGSRQLSYLIMLGSPTCTLVVGDTVTDAMVRRGWLRQDRPRVGICITPAGLRALADEMEAGRVRDGLQRMEATATQRRAAVEQRRKRR